MKVNMTGIQVKTCLRLVGGRRVHPHLQEHREAHDQRPDTECQEVHQRRVIGQEAEEVEDLGRVRRREILIQPKKGA